MGFCFHLKEVAGFKEQPACTKAVCGNAPENVLHDEGENFAVLEGAQLGNMSEEDLSRGVGEITEIVRAENGSTSVEERLENEFGLKAEFFDKTYNTMLCIVGEAKEFGLVKKLVDEFEVRKDVNTWTILIFHYGKAKKISEALSAFEIMNRCGCLPDEVSYRAVIHSLCSAWKGDIAMEFYKDMIQKDMVLDVRLYKLLMNYMAKSGDVAAVSLLAWK
ncbi:Tetratricopeptide-like helical domain superfamily [Sesbania bispinosa]|nr:Tetratricopeptide-like helical domain superfamily [Sesbania bispinosa]